MFGSRVLLQRSTTMVRRQLTTNRGTPASLRSTMQPWIAEKRWSSSDAKPEPSAASSTENGGANNNTDASTPATPTAGNEEKITQLEKEIKELKDRVVRSLAEEENVRRIAKRDVDNARAYAVSGFAKSLLDVADILEMALLSVPKEGEAVALADAATALKTLTTGVAMTEKNLQKAFNQHGVVKYGAEGDAFDPALHDALYSAPAEGKKSGTIAQVLKAGYKLKDRVLRPAQVGTVA